MEFYLQTSGQSLKSEIKASGRRSNHLKLDQSLSSTMKNYTYEILKQTIKGGYDNILPSMAGI